MSAVSKKKAFLAALKVTASITKAAQACDIERGLHYRWLKDDPHYATDFQAAIEEAGQSLEDEAIRRAHEGILKPVIYHGRVCYEAVRDANGQVLKAPMLDATGQPKLDAEGNAVTEEVLTPLVIREYSDTLLITLLKAFRPAKYARQELTGPGGGPIQAALTVTFVEPDGSASPVPSKAPVSL